MCMHCKILFYYFCCLLSDPRLTCMYLLWNMIMASDRGGERGRWQVLLIYSLRSHCSLRVFHQAWCSVCVSPAKQFLKCSSPALYVLLKIHITSILLWDGSLHQICSEKKLTSCKHESLTQKWVLNNILFCSFVSKQNCFETMFAYF